MGSDFVAIFPARTAIFPAQTKATARTAAFTNEGIGRRLVNAVRFIASIFARRGRGVILGCFTRLRFIAPTGFRRALETFGTFGTFGTFRPFGTLRPVFALAPVIDRGLIEGGEIAFHREIRRIIRLVAQGGIALLPAFITALTLLFLSQPGVGDHAKIMVCELQIIFRRDAITIEVGIVGQLAIFFQHLRGIAARTAVHAIQLLAATAATATATPALRAIVAAATPAIVVIVVVIIATIIVQG